MGVARRPSTGETIVDVAFIEERHPPDAKNWWTESRLFLELAIPTCLISFGFTWSPLLTASYVGLRFGPVFLSAFSLGNLTGNLCTFSLLAGLFSAADTLAPQAFGIGDYKEVGLIALRGAFASVVLVAPVNVLLILYLEELLVAVGQDPEAAFHAAAWYRIFVWAMPFVVVYDATWKFLSAQHVMRPLIYVSLFSCVVVLPIALEFFTAYYGFLGSAMAYVFFQASQCTLLVSYLVVLKPHVEGTWPGLGSWREALKYKPMMEYISLGAGGILSQSEWIYWEGEFVDRVGVATYICG
jgi:MATE family multidrug resistance protein